MYGEHQHGYGENTGTRLNGTDIGLGLAGAKQVQDWLVDTSLYDRLHWRAKLASVLRAVTGNRHALLRLSEAADGVEVRGRHDAGVQTVPIARIIGSEGRCHCFDSSFRPLQDDTRYRWLRVAQARREGIPLPPVDLIRLGEVYFVRDGHHRISVARALGQSHIEADVRVWETYPAGESAETLWGTQPILEPASYADEGWRANPQPLRNGFP